MANICFVHNALEKNNLKLEHPTGIKGGAYLSTISNSDNTFYLQMPKCMMRNGIVKTGKKTYCDLMFSNTDSYVVSWFENLETIIQDLIYEKKTLWFNGELEMSDIEGTFINIIKTYRSGNNYLVRCLLPKDSSSVLCYNDDEEAVSLDKIVSEETLMIPLVEIADLRFTSRNFQVDIILREIMIVTEEDSDEENSDVEEGSDAEEDSDEEEVANNDNSNDNSNDTNNNNNNDNNNESQLNISEEPVIELNIEPIENHGSVAQSENTEENGNTSEESSIIKAEMEANGSSEVINVANQTNNINNETQKVQSSAPSVTAPSVTEPSVTEPSVTEPSMNAPSVNEKAKVNSLEEVSLDLDTLDNSEAISLKSPQNVYYAIWQNAKQRLKFHRNEALKAFLDAKNIKNTYLVDQIDNDSEDEFKMQ